MSKAKTGNFVSVWDALFDNEQERANLRVRSELMSKLAAIVRARGRTQKEAAARCTVTQPRINDLLRGRLSRFSLDALVNIAAALGQRVQVDLEALPHAVRRRQLPLVPSRQLARRSPEQIANALDQVVALVKAKRTGCAPSKSAWRSIWRARRCLGS